MKSNFVQFFCIRYNIFVTKHQTKYSGLKIKTSEDTDVSIKLICFYVSGSG